MSIAICKYNPEQKNQWNNFLAGSKNGLFMFNRNYMDYHQDRFEDYSLIFYNDEEIVALLPLNVKGDTLYSHGGLTFGGFITNTRMRAGLMLECFDALREYMNVNGLKRLIYKAIPHIYHQYPAEEDLYALFRNQAQMIKVEPSTAIGFVQPIKFSKGRKSQIQRARKLGVSVISSTNFKDFLVLENEVLEQRHHTKAVHSATELELLYNRFPQNIELFTAEYEKQIVAGAVVFVSPQVVHTQYLAANEIARQIGALDLVIATLIEKYRSTKRYFDFGISTEEGGKILNEGLIQQKETFGARTIAHLTFEWNV